jgi:hypothetical protein
MHMLARNRIYRKLVLRYHVIGSLAQYRPRVPPDAGRLRGDKKLVEMGRTV